jgi:hypothetical protein
MTLHDTDVIVRLRRPAGGAAPSDTAEVPGWAPFIRSVRRRRATLRLVRPRGPITMRGPAMVHRGGA